MSERDQRGLDRPALLVVYAHPDDEAYGSAGTLAKYAHEGVSATVVSATRGELGEISERSTATTSNLAAVREAELRHACAIVGVSDVRFLDCPDGGVAACDRDLTVGKIVRVLRERRPHVVITFGPEGIYGHPDHIAVHELTVAACDVASDPRAYGSHLEEGLLPYQPRKVYFRTIPKHQIPRLAPVFTEIRRSLGIPGDVQDCFAPDELVTTQIDVRSFVPLKQRAILAHRTQMHGDPFAGALPEELEVELGFEHYCLRDCRRLPGQPHETDLFAGFGR